MRKITSFLLGLLCLCGTAAWAQPAELSDPLLTSAEQLSSPFSDRDEGTNLGHLIDFNGGTFWHSDWHGDKGDDGNGRHWLQMELPEAMEGPMVLWIQRRGNTEDHPSKAILTGSVSDDFAVTIPIATIELGNASNGQQFTSEVWTIPTPVKFIRFTVSDCKGENNGFRKFWHAAEINLFKADAASLLKGLMTGFLNSYDEYLWGEFETVFDIGTDAGQYSDSENAARFQEILKTVNAIVSEEMEQPSEEEIRAMIDEAKTCFEAYLASQNEYVLPADGYYRIVSIMDYTNTFDTGEKDEYGMPIKETITGVRKSMYSKLEGVGAWHTYDANDCRDVWNITRNDDNTVNIINAATEMGFVSFDNPVRMSTDPAQIKKMKFDWARKSEKGHVLGIRDANADPTGGTLLHQLNHGDGTGMGDVLCCWWAGGASEWYLEPVAIEEAEFLIAEFAKVKDHDQMVIRYKDMLSQAKSAMAVAEEAFRVPYLTHNEQFSTNMNELEEGNLNNMLDGDWNTFWHSDWNSGIRPMGTHSLDITFDEPLVGDVQVWIQRRNTKNNHCVLWNIYGSNDPESLTKCADFEGNTDEDVARWRAQTTETWTLIAAGLVTPYDPNVHDLFMPDFNVPEPYKYMRLVAMDTKSTEWGEELKKGYFHLGGIQIYKVTGKPQIESMAEVGEIMKEQIAFAETVADADLTEDDYKAFEDAFAAFSAILKDPREMRNTVAQYKDYHKRVFVGTEPSQWPSDAEANALEKLVTEANEYDKGGVYDQAKLDEYTAAMHAAANTFMSAANKLSTNVWYRLRFPTEEHYAKYGWSDGNIRQNEGYTMGDLFGQYAAVADYLTEGEYEGNPLIAPKETDAMREGDAMRFTALDNIENADAALFRFVPVSETEYVIQNKATGLYISCAAASSNAVTMGLDPTVFTATAAGYGATILHGKTLAGADRTALHAQRADHRLVTWGSYEASSNSGLWLETVAEVNNDEANAFVRDFEPGKIYTFTNPTGLKLAEGSEDVNLYAPAGTFTQDDKSFIALNKIEETQPGVPYLAILGTPEDYVEGEEVPTEPSTFVQTEAPIAAAPDSINGLIGTYTAITLEVGLVTFEGNKAMTAEDKIIENEDGTVAAVTNRALPAYGAYLKFGHTPVPADGNYDLVIEIGGSKPTDTAIREVLGKVAKSGAIYDLNGRVMMENGNMNDVKRLGRGIYILNGVKVSVR